MTEMKIWMVFLFGFFMGLDCWGQIGFDTHNIVDNVNTANNAKSVYGADLDGDGDTDLISASFGTLDGRIAWYRNEDGLGDFSQQILITNNVQGAWSVYAEDLDGDGDMDVLSASNFDDKIEWYENMDGLGTFSSPNIISLNADGAYSVFATDLDGDGDIDVLSASQEDDKIAWYENMDGQGTFSSEKIITTNADDARSVYAADLDGDGDMDVLSASNGDSDIAWYENMDGEGTFGTSQIINPQASSATAVYATDIDGDGDIDVISASYGNDLIAWYENIDGQGSFGNVQTVTSNAEKTFSVYASDMDADGDMDILSSAYGNDNIEWYENTDGQGTFNLAEEITNSANGVRSAYAVDIDNDSDMDVVSASETDDRIAWYENTDGQGSFGIPQDVVSIGYDFSSLFPSDIDGDGDLDVLATALNDDKLLWFENKDGLGDFSNQKIIPTSSFGASSVYAADLDADGDMDVLCSFSYSGKIIWCENTDGLGTFGTSQVITSEAQGANFIFASDVDGDGDMDILFSTDDFVSGDSKVAWHENMDGQGNFSSQQIIITDIDGASSVYTADVDGDGDMDVLSSSEDDAKLAWYENTDGQGDFGMQQVISATANEAASVYAVDIDNDGDVDVCSGLNDKVAWYENTDGQGSFGMQQIISTNQVIVQSIYAADIDGDSDIDILSASSQDKRIVWYENAGIAFNEINGKIRYDENSNGCDIADVLVTNVLITSNNGIDSIATFSITNGFYQLFPNEGNYTTTITPPNYYSVTPISHSSTFIGIGNTDTANFCLTPSQTVNDLNITYLPTSEARPGFDASYQLVYHNVGTTQLSGTITLTFDETKLNFLTASETIASQNNNTLTFDYADLNPFETRTIDLEFNVLPPPTVNIDEVLNFTATINPVAGDFTEADNEFTLEQIVIGSYDPNDIRVLEGEEILIEEIDRYLHYIIRFQNTGTADAINVRVENILDDKLDWNTIQLESTSHSNRVEIQDGNQLAFIFDGIYLPDSTSNEPASHGFIAYKIKPKSDIQIGDIISSTADIYFDFNPAVVTNTVMTEVVDPVSTNELSSLDFSIYPIPTKGLLTVQSKTPIAQIEIYDRLGKLVLASFDKNEIDISSLSRGFYFCKVVGEHGHEGIKKVVKE